MPLVSEDGHHPSLTISFESLSEAQPKIFPNSTTMRYDFKRADYFTLYSEIFNADWSAMGVSDDVNTTVTTFYDTLYNILDYSVPKYIPRDSKYPPWFTPEIKYNLKTKHFIRSKWIKTKNVYYHNEFKRLRCVVKTQIHEAYTSYLHRIENNIKNNPRDIWKFVHSKRGTTRIPGLLFNGENEYSSPQDIVNAFADAFSNVYLPDTKTSIPDIHSNMLSFSIRSISEEDVLKSISALSNKDTAGDDLIPSYIVKDCRHVLVKPLTKIFNLALRTGVFPEVWKRARIVPVLKKGDASNILNYRPISIISNFAKVFEHLLYTCIYSNVMSHISLYQHGFVAKRSTITNLATISQFVCENLDRGGQVDVVYTDFSKAFDSIDHHILLQKLSSFGMSSLLLRLIYSYLDKRANYVFFNGFRSYNFSSTSGVPQGSNLGPLLFVIFINDLLEYITCPVLAFADDIKIYNAVDDIGDTDTLQMNLLRIVDWCKKNKLQLNLNKCTTVTYTRRLTPIETSYFVGDFRLSRVSSIRDLGVVFDVHMNFTAHIEQLCMSTSKTLGFIYRITTNFVNVDVIKSLYNAFVRSRLEYGSIIWRPIYRNHSFLLERIQRRFLKFISFKMDTVYPPRGVYQEELLQRHGMVSLSDRRDRQCVKFLSNLIQYNIDCEFLLSRVLLNVPRLTSRLSASFSVTRARTNILLRAPVFAMCSKANEICGDIFVENY